MKEEKEKSIKHFNSTAGEYDSSFDGRFVKVMYEPLLDELDKNVEGKFLDVGCGTGNILCKLVNGKRELFGIDLSENMVRECSKRMKDNAEIKVADAEHMPYKDNFFDVLICNASFHHYPHPAEVLKEMKRVLKNGGRLLIGEGYAIQPFRAILNVSFHFSDSGDFKSYGKHEFIRMLEDNGFNIDEVKKTSNRTILYIAIA
ncbi:methyltransferase domain-containing protein [Clostridium chromiireducens]|uniref:Methyltransferase domain-containing protein n=1 Tax=Clostridium chromiireducens TaxID=225345 RepID=A0A964W2P3_9CLOT|nr:class I SAM-dependent methyltransferase [Clostridium chromiireducens]MVX64297.1 methyltransferase domain-containing protein [Clostridium chromiireducens]